MERARKALDDAGEDIDEDVFERLAGRLDYLHGDVTDSQLYRSLAERIGSDRRPLYYLEMPPALFAPIVENLAEEGLLQRARVAVEKPFGHDLESGRELKSRLRAVLAEDQILLVDHYLGKQPVIELEFLRFANRSLARLWDRDSVAAIHITMAEDLGVEERGEFYDAVGALRDVVQNHLLQVLALVAMDPPVGPGADDLNDKKAEVFRAMSGAGPRAMRPWSVPGLYRNQRCRKGFDDGDLCCVVHGNRQLALGGVPIYLRAGKGLPEKVTEVRLLLHRVPALAFLPDRRPAEPNQIVLRINPDPGMRLQLSAHGDTWTDIHLDSSFVEDLGEPVKPYEHLLHAALIGDHQHFAREDSVEETWRIVQPLLDNPSEIQYYDRGTWGPEAAQAMLPSDCGWHQPWMPRKTDSEH